MVQEHNRERAPNHSWWADALDPVENLRALADVQAFGRRAAEELADRLLAWGDGRPGAGVGAPLTEGAGGSEAIADLADLAERFRADAIRASEVSASLAEHAMALIGILIDRLPPARRADTAARPVVLKAVPPGDEARGLFWVHNTSPTAVAAVRPHCAAPRSHTGCELAADGVVFDPPILDPLPARSTCGIEVCVRVPPSAAPGTYVSVVMAANLPELYLPLHVTVEPAEGER